MPRKIVFTQQYRNLEIGDATLTSNGGHIMRLSARLECKICGRKTPFVALGTLTGPNICSEECLSENKQLDQKALLA